jgi:hypothetical protein
MDLGAINVKAAKELSLRRRIKQLNRRHLEFSVWGSRLRRYLSECRAGKDNRECQTRNTHRSR